MAESPRVARGAGRSPAYRRRGTVSQSLERRHVKSSLVFYATSSRTQHSENERQQTHATADCRQAGRRIAVREKGAMPLQTRTPFEPANVTRMHRRMARRTALSEQARVNAQRRQFQRLRNERSYVLHCRGGRGPSGWHRVRPSANQWWRINAHRKASPGTPKRPVRHSCRARCYRRLSRGMRMARQRENAGATSPPGEGRPAPRSAVEVACRPAVPVSQRRLTVLQVSTGSKEGQWWCRQAG